MAVIWTDHETLVTFPLFKPTSVTCIVLCGSSFGAMAMEPVAHIGSTSSSVQRFFTTSGPVAVGSVIGQSNHRKMTTLALGYLCIGEAGLGFVTWVERGRLFHARMI